MIWLIMKLVVVMVFSINTSTILISKTIQSFKVSAPSVIQANKIEIVSSGDGLDLILSSRTSPIKS